MLGAIVLIVVLLSVGSYLVFQEKRRERLLRLRMKKLFTSELFSQLHPLLRSSRRLTVESVSLDKTCVRIRFVYPLGSEYRFDFREHGLPLLTEDKLEALTLLVEECLPVLSNHDRYALRCTRRRMIDGSFEHVYAYVIRNSFKTAIIRAPYYDGSLNSSLQLW